MTFTEVKRMIRMMYVAITRRGSEGRSSPDVGMITQISAPLLESTSNALAYRLSRLKPRAAEKMGASSRTMKIEDLFFIIFNIFSENTTSAGIKTFFLVFTDF